MAPRVCEICSAGSPGETRAGSSQAQSLTRVVIEGRIVALCETHVGEVERAGIATLSQLFELFPEPSGQRRAPERRSPLDRRIFPARPEGRRRGMGRRATDGD